MAGLLIWLCLPRHYLMTVDVATLLKSLYGDCYDASCTMSFFKCVEIHEDFLSRSFKVECVSHVIDTYHFCGTNMLKT